jgi:hypothetical protein
VIFQMLKGIGDLVGNAKSLAGTAFTEFTTALDDNSEPGVNVSFGPASLPATPHADATARVLKILGCDSVIQVETEADALRAVMYSHSGSLLHAAAVAVETAGGSKLLAAVDAMQETHEEEMKRLQMKYDTAVATAASDRSSLSAQVKDLQAKIDRLEEEAALRILELGSLKAEAEQGQSVIRQLIDDKLKLNYSKRKIILFSFF